MSRFRLSLYLAFRERKKGSVAFPVFMYHEPPGGLNSVKLKLEISAVSQQSHVELKMNSD